MRDLGFGMVDRRTVAAVLFTLVLAQQVLGLQMPINTTDVRQLFVDLVLFTGFLYACRTLVRLPIVVSACLADREWSLLLDGWVVFAYPRLYSFDRLGGLSRLVLGTVDRAAIVASVLLTGLPAFHTMFARIGQAGLALMVIVYILSSGFTWLARDAVDVADARTAD